MEQIITESGLDWTILRPPQLTDKPHTGKYRVRDGHLPPFGFKDPACRCSRLFPEDPPRPNLDKKNPGRKSLTTGTQPNKRNKTEHP